MKVKLNFYQKIKRNELFGDQNWLSIDYNCNEVTANIDIQIVFHKNLVQIINKQFLIMNALANATNLLIYWLNKNRSFDWMKDLTNDKLKSFRYNKKSLIKVALFINEWILLSNELSLKVIKELIEFVVKFGLNWSLFLSQNIEEIL
jgi:hypothetical protein